MNPSRNTLTSGETPAVFKADLEISSEESEVQELVMEKHKLQLSSTVYNLT